MIDTNIKRIRKLRHMTQKDLADALEIDASVVSKYESGKVSPSYKRLTEIADVLQVEVETLFNKSTSFPSYDRRRMVVTSVDEDTYMAGSSLLADDLRAKAGGICELCGAEMPLIRNETTWMLETHYIEWLSKGGRNVEGNIAVLCPTCHKYIHMIPYEESIRILRNAKG